MPINSLRRLFHGKKDTEVSAERKIAFSNETEEIKMPDETTENLTLMAVFLAGISGVILIGVGEYVVHARENLNPFVIYSSISVSLLLLAFSYFVFGMAERMKEEKDEEKSIYRRRD